MSKRTKRSENASPYLKRSTDPRLIGRKVVVAGHSGVVAELGFYPGIGDAARVVFDIPATFKFGYGTVEGQIGIWLSVTEVENGP